MIQVIPGLNFSSCPCCSSVNIIRVNGITCDNNYKSLEDYILKKIFSCRKCKEELGLFVKDANNGHEKITKIFWLEDIQCNDRYHEILKKLEDVKIKNIKSKNKKYYEALKQISNVQNQIRQEKIKLKVKLKIQKKGMLIRHVY